MDNYCSASSDVLQYNLNRLLKCRCRLIHHQSAPSSKRETREMTDRLNEIRLFFIERLLQLLIVLRALLICDYWGNKHSLFSLIGTNKASFAMRSRLRVVLRHLSSPATQYF